jgi:hypothetical protein
MASKEIPYEAELRRIVRGSRWLMGILKVEKGIREKWPKVRIVEETRPVIS